MLAYTLMSLIDPIIAVSLTIILFSIFLFQDLYIIKYLSKLN